MFDEALATTEIEIGSNYKTENRMTSMIESKKK